MTVETLLPVPAAERVAKGAELLDQLRPGWHEKIDVSKLDIGSSALCVISQLHRDQFGVYAWSGGIQEITQMVSGVPSPNWVEDCLPLAWEHGFLGDGPDYMEDSQRLTVAWLGEIQRRREQA